MNGCCGLLTSSNAKRKLIEGGDDENELCEDLSEDFKTTLRCCKKPMLERPPFELPPLSPFQEDQMILDEKVTQLTIEDRQLPPELLKPNSIGYFKGVIISNKNRRLFLESDSSASSIIDNITSDGNPRKWKKTTILASESSMGSSVPIVSDNGNGDSILSSRQLNHYERPSSCSIVSDGVQFHSIFHSHQQQAYNYPSNAFSNERFGSVGLQSLDNNSGGHHVSSSN